MWYFSPRVIKGWLLITEFSRGERGIRGMTSGELGFWSSGAFNQTRSSIFFHRRSAGVQQAQTTTRTGVWRSQDGLLAALLQNAAPHRWIRGQRRSRAGNVEERRNMFFQLERCKRKRARLEI